MRYEPETERFYLARMYSEAVHRAGGLPVHIPLIPDAEYLATLVARCDGVLLPGSASDIDPRLYGSEPHTRLGSVHPIRDATDQLVLDKVEERQMPLLAICYGLQAWNVRRGGTLIQDIGSEYPAAIKHEQGAPRDRRSHKLRIASQCRLAACAGAREAYVNSHHHQAIATIGRDLRAVAWAADGLIEAVEDVREDAWMLGVQWHPEIAWEQDEFASRIFRDFVAAATQFAEQHEEGELAGAQTGALSV